MTKINLLRRCLGGVFAVLALYAGIGFLALPAILKSQARQFADVRLHRQLSIEQASFNPFTMALTLQGVKLMEPQGAAVFLGFERLTLDLSGQSLWRMAPIV